MTRLARGLRRPPSTYDFEPVEDGDPHLLAILRETRPVTRSRGALLSISAIHIEPFAGPAALLRTAGL